MDGGGEKVTEMCDDGDLYGDGGDDDGGRGDLEKRREEALLGLCMMSLAAVSYNFIYLAAVSSLGLCMMNLANFKKIEKVVCHFAL